MKALARTGVTWIFTYNSGREEVDKIVTAVAETGARPVALPVNTGHDLIVPLNPL